MTVAERFLTHHVDNQVPALDALDLYRTDTHCIDIGCHIGSFLQKITTIAPKGRHFAVEPVPQKAARLREKFPSVTVLEVALGETHGTAEFFINQSQTSYSGLKKRAVPGALQAVQVQCRRLDEVIPADAHIGFMKIDVNGAESMVLRGALELLRRDRPAVLLECTQGGLDDYGVSSDDVYDFLVGTTAKLKAWNGYCMLLRKRAASSSGPSG